jgi:hypothetical protein
MAEWPKTVRTTIQPEVDLVVEQAEYNDLKVQGLLLPGYEDYQGVVPEAAKSRKRTDTQKED